MGLEVAVQPSAKNQWKEWDINDNDDGLYGCWDIEFYA